MNLERHRLQNGEQVIFQRDNNQTVSFTNKSHAFNVFINPGGTLWSFDMEGRLIGMYVEEKSIRRTMDNRFYLKSRVLIGLDLFRTVEEIKDSDIAGYYQQGLDWIVSYMNALPDEFAKIARRIISWDLPRLRAQRTDFQKIYHPISILPPDQYLALVLQITLGCSYNKCAFCNFYRDRSFRIKSLEQIRQHAIEVKNFFGRGLSLRRSIFLGDANALAMPQRILVPALSELYSIFPEIQNYYAFIDVYTGIKKSSEDFIALKRLGLKRVYFGIETGNSELLELLNKPRLDANLRDILGALKNARIGIGLIFLSGIGGRKYIESHVEDSASLVQSLSLGESDIVYISEYYDVNPEYQAVMDQNGIPPLSRQEIRRQTNYFKNSLKQVVPRSVKVSTYDIQQFCY